jgi:hypothetical protein
MQQQQQETKTIGVKATFVPTNEHRFIALPSPPSFDVLVDKLASLFAIDLTSSDLRVHYIDDESDRVAMSSSDELTCALSMVPAGRQLRLFISVAPSNQLRQQEEMHEEEQVKTEPKEEQDCALPAITAVSIVAANPNTEACAITASSEVSSQAATSIEELKAQLQAAGVDMSMIDEERCLRVLARFEDDVAKTAKAIERVHARKQQHQLSSSNEE